MKLLSKDDKYRTLCLCLPSNEPYTMNNYFLPSLHNFKDVADYCTFSINFQYPYTKDEVESIVSKIRDLGFNVVYNLRDKYEIKSEGLVPITRIRHDSALMYPNALFYGLCDDDFKFLGESAKSPSSGEQFLRALHYMLKFNNCGGIITGGSMYKYVPINHIGITRTFDDEWYITGKGFIFRSLPEAMLVEDDAIDLLGAGEEKLIAAYRLNKGMFFAKYSNSRIQHDEIRRGKDPNVKSGEEEYNWLEENIIENNLNKYLNNKFDCNIHGVYSYNVVREDVYKKNNGPDHEKDRYKYLINYNDYSKDRLIKEIDEMLIQR